MGLINFDKIPNHIISGQTEEEIPSLIYESIDSELTTDCFDENDNEVFDRPAHPLNRFAQVSNVAEINKQTTPMNTKKRNKWADKMFSEWCWVRQSKSISIHSLNDYELNEYISQFIHETRKKNGDRYPPRTLVNIIAGLQSMINENIIDGSKKVNFFRGDAFAKITSSLDAAMKISTKNGLGLSKKPAEVMISHTEEKQLWEKALGDDEPTKLLHTLFYLNGVHFALWGGEEHAELTIDQFEISTRIENRCLIHREKQSKTFKGGLKDLQQKPKEVIHFETTKTKQSHIQLHLK